MQTSNNCNSAKTESDIAKELGISISSLQNYKKLTEMIPELEELIDTGITTPTTALAIMHGKLVECEVEYDLLRPVIYRNIADGEQRIGIDFGIKGYTFASDESEMYDFFIMEDYTWIIQDVGGSICVWDSDCLDCCNTFFGNPETFVYEK